MKEGDRVLKELWKQNKLEKLKLNRKNKENYWEEELDFKTKLKEKNQFWLFKLISEVTRPEKKCGEWEKQNMNF